MLDALTCSGAHYSELFDVLPQQVDTDLFVSRCAMSRAFNAVMRVISSLIGVLMVLMGGIWILQGLNLAWGSLSRSFMQGDQHWVFYGAIMLIVGVCQVVWSNTRQRE
jgi:polyferredoxin